MRKVAWLAKLVAPWGAAMTINDRKSGPSNELLPMALAVAVVTFALACAILLALVSDLAPRV